VPLWACERREGMEVAVRLGHVSNGTRRRRAATYAEQLSDKRRCGTCADAATGDALARPG
jgi:hypothetical protein